MDTMQRVTWEKHPGVGLSQAGVELRMKAGGKCLFLEGSEYNLGGTH